MPTTLVLLDRDLRLHDHAPLWHAAARGAVVPVFVWAPEDEGDWPMGAASRAWLARSLAAFADTLAALGSRLVVRRGPTVAAVEHLVRETGADAVTWHARHTPAGRRLDEALLAAARRLGVHGEAFDGRLLHDPEEIRTGKGDPYQVYTPFWNALARTDIPLPLPAPDALPAPDTWPEPEPTLEVLVDELRPEIPWDDGFWNVWTPGENAARKRLRAFAAAASNDPSGVLGVGRYATMRNRPDLDGSSRLSPHLAHGELSARTVWHAAEGSGEGRAKFRKEVAWRDFAYHLLWHFPHTPTEPLRPAFARVPWRDAPGDLRAWQQGRTGVPYLDAALRQLWTTGWMHNRPRMAVAGFLVKQLLLPWQDGARWFWDTLVDADLANNTLGWQWVTGSGADAAPYFRILNPVLQGQKFDPEGRFVHAFVPELARLDPPALHAPWEAPATVLRAAGVRLGETYPLPLVDQRDARRRALDAYEETRSA